MNLLNNIYRKTCEPETPVPFLSN